MRDNSDVLLRWSVGKQDTVSLSEFEDKKFADFISLSKLSILSFQKRFPGARFVVLYNGTGRLSKDSTDTDNWRTRAASSGYSAALSGNPVTKGSQSFVDFVKYFNLCLPNLLEPVDIIDQVSMMSDIPNPYHFAPRGVWWKWLPFRLDISKHEIAIDTDIICINEPKSWYKWLDSTEEIIIAPERYEKVLVNTCGDFAGHPVLKNKKPLNCGVVGQRAGCSFEERFFEITENVNIGSSRNSLFITEQGAINVWVRSLEREGVKSFVLNFEKNAWMRDFLYFMHRGIKVETIHAVTWYKTIIKSLSQIFERKIIDFDYTDDDFFSDLLKQSTQEGKLVRFTLARQLGPDLGDEIDFIR